jgi:methyl-accepting chemotaxis protein
MLNLLKKTDRSSPAHGAPSPASGGEDLLATAESKVKESEQRLAEVEERLAETAQKLSDTEAKLAETTFKKMVDDMPVNVMTCDPKDFKINYVNKTSLDTLAKLEHLLPCKASELFGQCVDIFHKDPSHQRRILSDPANLPYSAKIKLGDETLDLLATAVRDDAGNYVGPMLTWKVITEQEKADAENARLIQMIDDMPITAIQRNSRSTTSTRPASRP